MAGRVAGGLYFDGVNDQVSAPRVIPAHDYRALTVDAWIRPSSTSSNDRTIVDFGGGMYTLILEGNQLRFAHQAMPTSFAPITTTANIPINQWTHVAVVADPVARQFRFYRNGAFVSAHNTGFYNPTGYYTGASWTIGNGFGFPFHGIVDEVEIFERVLAQSEIQSIFAAGASGKCK